MNQWKCDEGHVDLDKNSNFHNKVELVWSINDECWIVIDFVLQKMLSFYETISQNDIRSFYIEYKPSRI